MPRPFHLIAHNPNTVDEAIAALAAGANALKSDVYYADNNFYVMERIPVWSKILAPKKGPLLADYLSNLQARILESQISAKPLHLSLILFDTKNLDRFPVSKLFTAAKASFSLSSLKLGVTTGNKKCLSNFKDFAPAENELIGIDRGCGIADAHRFFKGLNTRYTYANGTSLPLIPTTAPIYLDEIVAAIQLRDSANAVKPALVYSWTVNSKASMRNYLRLGVDGLITDKIADAVSVLAEAEFAVRTIMA